MISVRNQERNSVQVVARLPGEEVPHAVVSVQLDDDEFKVIVQYEGEEPECVSSALLKEQL